VVRGKGPVRTGVTAIFPRGKTDTRAVFAGFFAGNGNGDMTGTHWVEESGVLETPILISGTGSAGLDPRNQAALAGLPRKARTPSMKASICGSVPMVTRHQFS
jgi:L-aminopeptidase/D-esterase-like protein